MQVLPALRARHALNGVPLRRCRGFGFVTFADLSSAQNALAHPEHTIEGRRCEAKVALPKVRGVRCAGGPGGAVVCDVGWGQPCGTDLHEAIKARWCC